MSAHSGLKPAVSRGPHEGPVWADAVEKLTSSGEWTRLAEYIPSTKVLNPFSSDLRGEHRTKTVPLEPHRFMADIDATFMQQILNIPKRKREPDIHHHR